MIALRAAITLLCAGGLYASQHMFRKSLLAERGELADSSIVEEPHARLFFGVPNSLFGCCYFPLLAAAVWLYVPVETADPHIALVVRWIVLAMLAVASATSAFLAVSLLFITRRACPFCWTSHTINLLLLCAVPWAVPSP